MTATVLVQAAVLVAIPRPYMNQKTDERMASSLSAKKIWRIADPVDAADPMQQAGEKANQARSLQPTRASSSISWQMHV